MTRAQHFVVPVYKRIWENPMSASVCKMKPTSSGAFEVPPEDNHLSRLVAMVDLGTHSREYGGKVDDKRMVYLGF